MTFLEPNYEIPQAPSNYMKFQKGMNKFRILSPAVTGWEYWNKENKPVRSKKRWETIPADIKLENGVPTAIKHFWAFVVWNYQEQLIQILQITQSTIQGSIKTGVDLRQGNATNNDIGVERKGDGFDTEYTVQFADPSPVAPEIEEAYKAKKIDLEALFDGGDPFTSDTPTKRGSEPNLAPSDDSTGDLNTDDLPF